MILVNQQNFTTNLNHRVTDTYHRVTDIYGKWPTENGLVGQGIEIGSEGSLFKYHLVLCQA